MNKVIIQQLRLPRLLALLPTLLLASPEISQAENWSRFRGPNGAGIASDVTFPATWTERDYLWKIALPGIGHSSPVGWEQRLFITSGNVESATFTLHCLAAESGEQLWYRDFAGKKYSMHASNSLASATPTVDQQHVFVTWADGGSMFCAALTHQGDEIWRVELGDFVGPHGFAASPVVVEGIVCVQVEDRGGGFMAGIDAAVGQLRWRAERLPGKASYATPCVVPNAGGSAAVISQSMTGGMQAVEVQTGKLLWQFPDLFPARCVSSPFLANDMIIGVCGGGGKGKLLVGMRLAADAQAEPVQQFTLTKQVPYVPTPLVKDNRLFLWHDRGTVSCLDLGADQANKIAWTERIGGKFFGSPIIAGDKIYCLSTDGRAVVIAAQQEFSLLGDNDLGEPTVATPAVHDGKLIFRTESTLACLAGN